MASTIKPNKKETNDTGTGTFTAGSGAPKVPNNSGGGDSGGAPTAQSLMAMMIQNSSISAGTLSPKGTEYKDGLISALDEQQTGMKFSTRIVSAENIQSLVFVRGNNAFILMFSETYMNPSISPDSELHVPAVAMKGVGTKVLEDLPVTNIIDTLVIHPNDYYRMDLMANHIKMQFMYLDYEASTEIKDTIAALSGNQYQIRISNDSRQDYMQKCPITPARGDVCIGVYQLVPENPADPTNNKKRAVPVMYIPGFTDLINNPSYTRERAVSKENPLYISLFRATEIFSIYPNIDIATLALAAVYNEVGIHGNHSVQFVELTKRNIGYITHSQIADKPLAENKEDVNNILNMVSYPSIYLDLTYGRPMIPGLKNILNNNQKDLVASFANYFGDTIPGGDFADKMFEEFGGIYQSGGDWIDSRNIDFLFQATQNPSSFGNDLSTISFLLNKATNPLDRVKQINSIVSGVEWLYFTVTYRINQAFLASIHKLYANKVSLKSNRHMETENTVLFTPVTTPVTGVNAFGNTGLGGGGILNKFN